MQQGWWQSGEAPQQQEKRGANIRRRELLGTAAEQGKQSEEPAVVARAAAGLREGAAGETRRQAK